MLDLLLGAVRLPVAQPELAKESKSQFAVFILEKLIMIVPSRGPVAWASRTKVGGTLLRAVAAGAVDPRRQEEASVPGFQVQALPDLFAGQSVSPSGFTVTVVVK